MSKKLQIYNSLSGKIELFEPNVQGHVGMYVCGPTVYSDVHLGNVRTFVSFDVIYRYLKYLGYQVKYVRNITDVGHLEGDADSNAEDKISQRARLEKLEPMQIVDQYSRGFHAVLRQFNNLNPTIEPRATGHIIEQIEMVQKILDNGFAYEANGSIYFDTKKLVETTDVYGKLSGRKVDDLLVETRNLKGQSEKRNPMDFAIWIKATPTHLMRWNSPWSNGFPGWHLECSAMSTKYLGESFDIHGGGNDLKFPHHENEIAQNHGFCQQAPAKYWLHTNMLLMNGKKMSKSDGNSITPHELVSGESEHTSKAYHPMVVRFFMLQSHYRSTMDISDTALAAAEKGFNKLMEANNSLQSFETKAKENQQLGNEIQAGIDAIFSELNDDFNTPKALARMFELVSKINGLKDGHLSFDDLSKKTLNNLKSAFKDCIFNIFGLKEATDNENDDTLDGVMQLIIDMRQSARENKDWATSDKIRDALKAVNIAIKDGKDGTTWTK